MKGYQEIFVDSVRDDAAPGWLVDAVHERWAIGLRGARLITVSENAMYALEADRLGAVGHRQLSRGHSVALPKVAILAEGLEVAQDGGAALADGNDVIDVQDGA